MTPEQMSREQLKKFLVYYRKRIDQEPGNVEARLRLATVFREMGQTPRAVKQYEKAAQLLDEQGLALEAIAACKAILELDPSRVKAQYFLARLYAQTPDATDQSARVAQPIDAADDAPTREYPESADAELGDAEQVPVSEEGDAEESDDRPEPPPTVERSAENESTRVADYSELSDDFEWEQGNKHEHPTVELTAEERERREGFSREEMQELLTTIDVDPEDIVDIEDAEEYQLDEAIGEGIDQDSTPDFELGAEDEIDDAGAAGAFVDQDETTTLDSSSELSESENSSE